MARERVLSGIQPSGEVHLGNYLGALRHWVTDQDVRDCFFCLVDLHAITFPQDPAALRQGTLELAALLIAVGLDPDRSTIFVQSHVHEHAEMAWVAGCFTAYGDLQRMTQFKDKMAKRQGELVSGGLFYYPVLQAADILLYEADRVPVGEDQRQHLELARGIAERFNARYGDTLVVPEPAIPPVGAKIMDLQDPTSKMSKSVDSPQGTLKVTDPPDVIRRKIRSAVTDSGRDIVLAEDKPAIANLLTIFASVAGRSIEDLEREYAGQGYGAFKADVAEAVVDALTPIQTRARELLDDPGELGRLLQIGADKAQAVAAKTLRTVYEKVGFLPRSG
jgi:tryptophanyl-tRNA synthetase